MKQSRFERYLEWHDELSETVKEEVNRLISMRFDFESAYSELEQENEKLKERIELLEAENQRIANILYERNHQERGAA